MKQWSGMYLAIRNPHFIRIRMMLRADAKSVKRAAATSRTCRIKVQLLALVFINRATTVDG